MKTDKDCAQDLYDGFKKDGLSDKQIMDLTGNFSKMCDYGIYNSNVIEELFNIAHDKQVTK